MDRVGPGCSSDEYRNYFPAASKAALRWSTPHRNRIARNIVLSSTPQRNSIAKIPFCRPFDVCSVPQSLCQPSRHDTRHEPDSDLSLLQATWPQPIRHASSSVCVTRCSTSPGYRYCTPVGASAVGPTKGKPSRTRAAKPRAAPAAAPCSNEGAPTADHIRLARPQSSPRSTHNVSVTIAPVANYARNNCFTSTGNQYGTSA